MIELDFFEMDKVDLRSMASIQIVPGRIVSGFNNNLALFTGGYVIPHRFATELIEITKPYIAMIENDTVSSVVTS